MDFTKIKTGDILQIKGKKYEVVEAWYEDWDILPSGKERWYSVFEMVGIKSGKITATHKLIHYHDEKEIFLLDKISGKKMEIEKRDVEQSL